MEDTITLRDIFQLGGGIVVIAGSYFAIKYQGLSNSKDIENVRKSNDEQWNKIDNLNEEVATIRERITMAIDMETAEKKFVTKEMFDLRMKQFDVDLKQTKGIAQNTLDAVQTLSNSVVNSRN